VKLAACAVYAVLLLGARLALAQASTPAEGEYVISDGAWGTLQVQARGKFAIETVGRQCAHLRRGRRDRRWQIEDREVRLPGDF
jgi:hypothetical protein